MIGLAAESSIAHQRGTHNRGTHISLSLSVTHQIAEAERGSQYQCNDMIRQTIGGVRHTDTNVRVWWWYLSIIAKRTSGHQVMRHGEAETEAA